MSHQTPPPQPLDLAKQAARAAGIAKFYGNNCMRNHGGVRYSKSGQCVQCVKMSNSSRKLKGETQ